MDYSNRNPGSSNTGIGFTDRLRRWHRTVALILAVFIFTIGLTGAALQAIIAIYGEAGPGGVNLPASIAPIRRLLFQIHTGFIAGMPGVYYGLIMGLGLLFFSLSGIWMYLNLWRTRAQLGRKNLFWATKTGNDATARSLHRWFNVGIVLFTTIIAFTGANLDFDFARNNMMPGSGPPPAGAMAQGPGAPAGIPGGAPGGPPGAGAPPGAERGPAPGVSRFGQEWHMGNFYVHKLNFFGSFGHYLGVLIGLALAAMAVSGVWVYGAMYARRKTAGQKGLFW